MPREWQHPAVARWTRVHYGWVIHLSNGLGAAVGPWLGGALYDATGSYRLAFGVAMASVGLACLSLWLAGGPRGGR